MLLKTSVYTMLLFSNFDNMCFVIQVSLTVAGLLTSMSINRQFIDINVNKPAGLTLLLQSYHVLSYFVVI